MPTVTADQQQSGFKSEQVPVQVTDEPECVFISYLSNLNRFIRMRASILVEQHPGAGGLAEQVLHPRNNLPHTTPYAASVDAGTKGDRIQVVDVNDRQHRRR